MTLLVEVCAAVILDQSGLLLATRAPGKDLSGQWELPGGKLHSQETPAECISRELHEELRLRVEQASLFLSMVHHYPHKSIRLHFLHCRLSRQDPMPQEGQKTARFNSAELPWQHMAEADRLALEFLRSAKWRINTGQGTELPEIVDLPLAERIHHWLKLS
ncbi:MAG: NUDIX domain-containing protein [Lentisphaeria bacterium]|nr:NUDIX domain-containing protein [Lentisphaeria bacterium]MDY0176001.1 NUDIX domain-containing protein [Lentisphaeria bacterium]